jgi:hypothetical protein
MANGFDFTYIVMYLIDALPGGSLVDAVRYATVEEAIFSTCPIGWRVVTSHNSILNVT